MSNTKSQSQLPSFIDGYSEAKLHNCFVAGWLLFTGVRILALTALPLDLSGDEAYYWEWGQQLDWGYYSKPPGIAWLMALAGRAGGNTTFGIRLFAVLLGAGGLWFLYALGRRLYGTRVGLTAAILFALLPASASLNLILTIDAPLMFCWMGALFAFWRFIGFQGKSLRWGVVLAFFLAGGLLSKQMMMAFYPLAVMFLISSPPRRAILRGPLLWVVFLSSLAALLPPLYWNSQNDWLTFQHTLHHFESGDVNPLARFIQFLEFIGAAMGLITPVLWMLIMGLILVALPAWKHLGERERFLWLFSGPGLLVITLMALRQRVLPNWPAVYLPAAVLFATSWAAGLWAPGSRLAGWQRAFRPALAVAVLFFMITYGAATIFSLGLISAPDLDPLKRLKGWRRLAAEVTAARDSLPDSHEMLIITQGHRYTTSELAFYLPDHPRVYRYTPHSRAITSQHDLWETPSDRLGKNALIIVRGSPDQLSSELRSRFRDVRFLRKIDHPSILHGSGQYALFYGLHLKFWPESHATRQVAPR